jgi:preprotein translocase subunit SecD
MTQLVRSPIVAACIAAIGLSACSASKTSGAPSHSVATAHPSSGSGSADAVPEPSRDATASLSIRQVYETNEPIMIGGTEVSDTPLTSSPTGPSSASPPSTGLPSAASPTEGNPATPEATPTAEDLAAYAKLDCSVPANQQGGVRKDLPNTFLITCGNPEASPIYYKYLLHPTLIAGKDVSTASAELDSQTGTQWDVLVTFKSTAANAWAKFTAAHVGTLISIVLDGNVYSAETIQGAITGPTQVTGSFTHKTASDLANLVRSIAAANPSP